MSFHDNAGIHQDAVKSLHLRRRAWQLAAEAHQAQLYPGSPLTYLTHVGEVVLNLEPALCADRTLNPDLAIVCAVLHDTVEDTEVTAEAIEKEFGREAAEGVRALTKSSALPKDAAMDDSLKRIKECPREVWVVKMADRTANMGPELPLHFWSRDKCERYAREGRKILEALAPASAVMASVLEERIENWERLLSAA